MKSLVSILLLLTMITGSASTGPIPDERNTAHLIVSIARNDFKQEYKLIFTKNGTDEVNDLDALNIGEGYVSIAGLINGLKLSIDQRATLKEAREVKLYVKGWATGNYTLRIKGKETFDRLTRITLIDRHANKRESINTEEKNYSFQIDLNEPGSQGNERFSLLFEQQQTQQDLNSATEIIYPNPFSDKLYIKTYSDKHAHAIVIIRNSLGVIVSRQLINLQQNDSEISVKDLFTGVYFIQLIDKSNNQTISTFKTLKK
ncbi:T9SS type A sorting domain-containing protein [Pedobacter psychroterrae]|uniref:T9SS type A sorting domain-containing protein n=1 Tax=Pedobacter psychroterrae TaxID=2530453 RepID=A0A4R0NRA5_9SPHI|nr:T9SS type A sorting domain-containing protein [Pedobacter psychroterrae]TCD02578.1 T9SS type A sorting domain-containing protein [Pedobacter psychroterrae]